MKSSSFNPIVFALRRPITIMAGVAALAVACLLSLVRMPIDVFPTLDLPVIFIAHFDVSNVPVGYLVAETDGKRPMGEVSDLFLQRVRPVFASLPGVSAPPPMGGNSRTILVNVDPDRLRAYRLSPDDVVSALS